MTSPSGPGAALVTAAGQRIGRALALELARMGAAVAVHFNTSKAAAESVVREIAAAGGRAAAVHGDLADARDALALVDRAAAAIGPLDCLVNNASLFERDEWDSVTPESWAAHLDINLRAPMLLSQHFAQQLPAGRDGNIVNMLDQRVWRLTPHFTSYTISKAGLWTLTQTLALALAPRIRVNGIGPGPVLPSKRQTQAQFDASCAATPLKRGSSPEEVAGALRFILASSSMTGQMIALDGGQHIAWRASDVSGGKE
jgi:NAD(P)-dependent dehydrogenase (short-subunit alcohol dehydrogenase family)